MIALADDASAMNVYWSPLENSWRWTRFCFLPTNDHSSSSLDPADAEADHHPVMQLGATTSDASAKAHDRVAVNAGDPFSAADRHALGEGGDDLNLLVARKDIHDGSSPHVVEL